MVKICLGNGVCAQDNVGNWYTVTRMDGSAGMDTTVICCGLRGARA